MVTRLFFLFMKAVIESSSSQPIPSISDVEESLSALQVQDGALDGASPLSPPSDSNLTPPALMHHTTTVSPSQILPTPPPSLESSPMVSTVHEKDTEEVTDSNSPGKLNLFSNLV